MGIEYQIKRGDIVFIGRRDREWSTSGAMDYLLNTWQKIESKLSRYMSYHVGDSLWIITRECITHILGKDGHQCRNCTPANGICLSCPYDIRNSSNNIDISLEVT